jgi:hypothetical protein
LVADERPARLLELLLAEVKLLLLRQLAGLQPPGGGGGGGGGRGGRSVISAQ